MATTCFEVSEHIQGQPWFRESENLAQTTQDLRVEGLPHNEIMTLTTQP